MAKEKNVEFEMNRKFDKQRCRHFLNDTLSVLHCHHYATLYCQLADDAEIVDGKALLHKAAEYTFLPVLAKYFEDNNVTDMDDRIALAEEYFGVTGLGTLKFERVGEMSCAAELVHSHVDEGWIKKWGKRDKPVNFIGQGYVAAAAAAIFGFSTGSYHVVENQSIVSGAETSRFAIVRA